MNLPKVIAIASATFATGLILSATALAVNLPEQTNSTKSSDVGNNAVVPSPVTNPRTPAQEGVPGGRLRSCQVREKVIRRRLVYLMNLVTNMELKFDSIATRVENYYQSKVVPSGKTVANYPTLVSDIQTKKATVSTAVTKTQHDVTSFSCNSSNPKAQMTQFREDMQSVKKALKDYRTSIKNLIVAVHSVR